VWTARILLLAAIAAVVVAALRYRTTEIVGATFRRPLANGGDTVYMYASGGHWYGHFQLWLAVAIGLVAASIVAAVASIRRRAG